MEFDEWMDAQDWPEDDLCPPPMDPQTGLDILCEEILGSDWHLTMPLSPAQANTEIVAAILHKFRKRRKRQKKGPNLADLLKAYEKEYNELMTGSGTNGERKNM